MMNYIITMNITTMATYVTLQFNDGEIKLSTSSFLFKQSKLFQLFDIEEDNTIPLICLRSYILDENDICLFDDKTDLSFMFTLQPNKFLEVCKFLDIICYENTINNFSVHFINYVMTNIKEEINIIKYFMQSEIRSIINYINKENADIQIKTCTSTFYVLYLTEYKEEVIKHNRIDLFELITNKKKFYRYIHKYNNQLTYITKETQEYNDYIEKISKKLIETCKKNNLNSITFLIEQDAKINFQDKYGYTPLHYASHKNNLEVIQYLVENGANINLQNNIGETALHIASALKYNLKVIQYLVENGANINLQNNFGYTALHEASMHYNNLKVIKYLVENGANIYLQNNNGDTALHYTSQFNDNLEVIRYLVEHGANVNLQNNYGDTALHFASQQYNNLNVIQYLVKNGANVNLQNNNGYTAFHFASQLKYNNEVIKYLQQIN